MSRSGDCTTGNLLDYLYCQKYYTLIGIDLSRQTNTNIPQQITFIGKIEENDDATMFFIAQKQQKNYFKLFYRFSNYNRIIYNNRTSKILNLLNQAIDFKFVTRKWNIVNDNSRRNYDAESEIIYNTEILKSNLCGYIDACILVRGNITIIGHQVAQVPFKNCAPFTKCIIKIDGTTIDDA